MAPPAVTGVAGNGPFFSLSRQWSRCVYADVQDERAIIRRLKAGDTAAFEQLYNHYRPRLFSFLARLTQQRELAEDLLQETWIRLARHAPRIEETTQLGPWLFTVARNLHRSHLRWAIVDLDRRRWLKQTMALGIEHTSPFDLASASELERAVERSVALLPIKYREALLLVVVDGFEPRAAAEVLGVKAETLRQRLSRARAMVSRVLALSTDGQGHLTSATQATEGATHGERILP